MKRYFTLMLMTLTVMSLAHRDVHAGPLTILGVPGQYNVFVFGDLTLAQTDVEGRAAAGGNITLDSFAIGTKVVPDEQGVPSLVAGNNAILTNGSVGCLATTPGCVNPKTGTVVYGGVTNQPDGPPQTVGYGTLQSPNFIDFAAAKSDIVALSQFWKTLTPNGTDIDLTNNFNFTGTDASLNIFNIQASDIVTTALTGPSVSFNTPAGSTILVNVLGDLSLLNLRNMGFNFNGVAGENTPVPPAVYSHNPGFPYSSILFNFPDETGDINLDRIGFNGSLIAPFADLIFTKDSHIDGNVIAQSLSGFGESHAIPFVGNIFAVPEPATLLLVAGGIAGMAARRRRT